MDTVREVLVFNDESGFTLVESLIVLVSIAGIALTVASYFQSVSKAEAYLTAAFSRDKAIGSLQRITAMPTALRVSLEKIENPELKACTVAQVVFVPGVPGDCVNHQLYPLKLYGPILSTGSGGTMTSGAISGTSTDPIRLDKLGASCPAGQGASLNCPFEVITWFKPQCPSQNPSLPPDARCDIAELIEVRYEIRLSPQINPTMLSKDLLQFRTVRGSSVVAVKKITGLTASFNPIVIPPPPPSPPPAPIALGAPSPSPAGPGPSPSGPSPSGPSPSSPAPAPVPAPPPPVPVVCPGETIQVGPFSCACPEGETLVNPAKGKCRRLSFG